MLAKVVDFLDELERTDRGSSVEARDHALELEKEKKW